MHSIVSQQRPRARAFRLNGIKEDNSLDNPEHSGSIRGYLAWKNQSTKALCLNAFEACDNNEDLSASHDEPQSENNHVQSLEENATPRRVPDWRRHRPSPRPIRVIGKETVQTLIVHEDLRPEVIGSPHEVEEDKCEERPYPLQFLSFTERHYTYPENEDDYNQEEEIDGDSDSDRDNQYCIERSDESEIDSDDDIRASLVIEPMVRYDSDSVKKSRQFGSLLSHQRAGHHHHCSDDDDDDGMNIRSPVGFNSLRIASKSLDEQMLAIREDLLPQQTTPHKQEEQQIDVNSSIQSWTTEQFRQYHDLLDFLQQTGAASPDQHISIPSARLEQMEQLLLSLLPQT